MGKKREFEQARQASARRIKGDVPLQKREWTPKEHTPQLKHLRLEIDRRAEATGILPPPRPAQWTWRKCVEWLMTHDDAADADASFAAPNPVETLWRSTDDEQRNDDATLEQRAKRMKAEAEAQAAKSAAFASLLDEYTNLAKKLQQPQLMPVLRSAIENRIREVGLALDQLAPGENQSLNDDTDAPP